MNVWSYKLFKPYMPVLASHLCFTVNSNEIFIWPQTDWDNKSPPVLRPGKWNDRVRGTGMFSIEDHLNLHWSDAMTSFPSCANATGEWMPHCQGSSQCVSIRAWGWTDNLIISQRNIYFWLGTRKKYSLFQTLPKLCILLVKWCLLPVLNVSILLWLNDTI